MNIDHILQELDHLFTTHQVDKVETFLKKHIEEAMKESNTSNQITLLNELIGFYRDSCQYEKSIETATTTMNVLQAANLQGSIPYATTLLNIANALRAAGALDGSMSYYKHVFSLYETLLAPNDFRYASLNNNMSLLYQEMQDYENACICLERALHIAIQYEDAVIEVATTHTNLAMSLLKRDLLNEAMMHLECAFQIFESSAEKDYHYSAALATMGEAKYRLGQLEDSAYYYQMSMQEIERNIGKTKDYELIQGNYNNVLEELKDQGKSLRTIKHYKKGLDLCEDFYRDYGIPMIHEKFPDYENMIAVGLVGEGSDCFGFDDEFSRDHDFGPGFCMWITDALYDEIGKTLQAEYENLPDVYMGIRRNNTLQAGKRLGVFRIGDFYQRLIGENDVPTSLNQWLYIEDSQFATSTNGRVFRDDLGEFTRIRTGILEYYPLEVWRKRISREAALIAQSGQYNYNRMLKRDELVTAHLALSEFTTHTMSMIYLLNRSYAPFYKWMHKGMNNLPILATVKDMLSELVLLPIGDTKISLIIEEIATLIIAQMNLQGLTKGSNNYLGNHTHLLEASLSKDELVEIIVKLEWNAFDQVENSGGTRADCQDDWNTFSIMRKSQFLAWPEKLIASYILDFKNANAQNRNLVTEKYGRMMISTDPAEYAKIKKFFPYISENRATIIEEIVKIQVDWIESFAKQYPNITKSARSIHTSEDSTFNTSYETYLRGELSVYSEVTLGLYGKFIVNLYNNEENLALNIISHTADLYGYNSLDDMEHSFL